MSKKIFLFVFIFLATKLVSGQTNSGFNYNIGVKLFSFAQPPLIVNNQSNSNNEPTYLPGLLLKINDNQIAYRIGFDYFTKNNFKFNNADTSSGKGKYSQYAFTLGFERDLSTTSFKPYFGADIGFIHTEFNGQQNRPGPASYSMLHTIKNGFLLSPFVGIKYNFIPRLYVSLESSISFLYAYNRVQNTNVVTSNVPVTHFTRSEFLTAPISLIGLHYNFASSN